MTKTTLFFVTVFVLLIGCSRDEECLYMTDDLCLNEEYLVGKWDVVHHYTPDDNGLIFNIRRAETEFFPDGKSFSIFVDSEVHTSPDSSFYRLGLQGEAVYLAFDNFYHRGQGFSSSGLASLFVYKGEDMFEVHKGQDTTAYDPTKLSVGEPLSHYLYIFTRK